MKRSTPIYLISQDYIQDTYGAYVPIPIETKTKVFAQITSVSGAEWFEGGRNGLNPEFRAEIYPFEYKGEEILEKDGVRYAIYRTYQKSANILELYCSKKKGREEADG